ncbi:FecR family protein [Pedobacter gandavensis]|uniref:FecR family protein n=1 Tax=Pedobacter gandavensis TaxID=2679963 RepID=UPI0029319838|nr:FecR family protein [Pedobacter gandavensis]
MQSAKLKELVSKYLANECTEEEKAFVERWYVKYDPGNAKQLTEAELEADIHGIEGTLEHLVQEPNRLMLWYRISAAALVVFSLSVLFYFYRPDKKIEKYAQSTETEIKPGGDKAMLTLSDGSKISLTDIKSGEIAVQSGLRISKSEDGQIVYTSEPKLKSNQQEESTAYNIIETPSAGKFQIVLPDGSLVWLDAESSLKYPVVFAGNERKVELTGQAYFEVAKSKGKSFKVWSKNQEVEVLGTHFNVNAYADQSATITTLLEGSIKLNSKNTKTSKLLKPGQQGVLTGNGIDVEEVDVSQAVGWKNGFFIFEKEEVATVLRQLERWYDVDISSEGSFDNIKIGGTISRSKSLSEVLRVLQLTRKIKFKIEGRRIIAMP